MVVSGVAIGIRTRLEHRRVGNSANDVALLEQSRSQHLLLGVEGVGDDVVVAADGKPVEQGRPVATVPIRVYEGLVRSAPNLVQDIRNEPVALHPGGVPS